MSRESALGDLLGVDTPVSPAEFGDEITLPAYVHTRMLDAVSDMAGDGSERSVHFRHSHDRWQGGLAVKGTGFTRTRRGDWSDEGPRTDRLHEFSAYLYPPHLHLHTHPRYPEEMAEEEALELAVTNSLSPDDIPDLARSIIELDALSNRFPSSEDIRVSLQRPPGTVGHLLATDQGSFLWLRTDVGTRPGLFPPSSPAGYRHNGRTARAASEYIQSHDKAITDDIDPESLSEDLAEIERAFLLSRARALSPAYVCYASGDPESAVLEKAGQ